MSTLKNKIDFAVVFSVRYANPNGDPLNGNRPRTTLDGYGEVSDVCIKRKIRNRMQDMGYDIFVQSEDRATDGYDSLKERADNNEQVVAAKKAKNRGLYAEAACKSWLDVRSFGQVFAFKEKGSTAGVSVSVRGPVSVQSAYSIEPAEVSGLQITKSVNGESGDKKSSDTMGTKHRVDFGIYVFKGSINCQLAEKTGFSEEDAEVIKEALRTLFENDCSAARPDGSMEVLKMLWWKHNCANGQYSSAKVHRTLKIDVKKSMSSDINDYEIYTEDYPDLKPETYE